MCKICSFIIRIFQALLLYIINPFDTQIYRKTRNLCDICSFISLYFIYQHIYHVSNVFLTHNICVSNIWTYERMNFTWFSLLICYMLNLWCAPLNLHSVSKMMFLFFALNLIKFFNTNSLFIFFITHYNPYMFIIINISHSRKKWFLFLFHHFIKICHVG